MTSEVRRVAPLRAANVVGLVYVVLGAAFAATFLPFAGWIPAGPDLDPQQEETMRAYFRGMLLAYPLLGGVFGWIGALVGAAVYNLAARIVGGLVVEMCSAPTESERPAV
jgi:hypothetical protein